MSIFNLGKKKEEASCCKNGEKAVCTCNGKCGGANKENAQLLVLGACCKKSADTFANVKQAAAELGLSEEVINIGDAVEIAKYGVMQTPALVIGGKVVAYGRLISVEEAKKLIENSNIL